MKTIKELLGKDLYKRNKKEKEIHAKLDYRRKIKRIEYNKNKKLKTMLGKDKFRSETYNKFKEKPSFKKDYRKMLDLLRGE